MRIQNKPVLMIFAGLLSLTAAFILGTGSYSPVSTDPGRGIGKSTASQQNRAGLGACGSSASKPNESFCSRALLLPTTGDSKAPNRPEIEEGAFLESASTSIRHPDPLVRSRALIEIAESSDDRAIDFLIAALADAEPSIRQLSITALHRFGQRIPTESLIGMALYNDDPQLRSEVLALLHRFCVSDCAEIMQLEDRLRLETAGSH